ncbi:hypothetical protein KDK_15500 [Dictyobacter kobayashii]|uniref:Uncharacterized protein n=1 Tax=Dictyobacter kobayashii TaxID=2014872 RepID=A0A402AF57_9CHLR|nr:hypothetical protein KDK_15500 [Dictyobacter kobayashii]
MPAVLHYREKSTSCALFCLNAANYKQATAKQHSEYHDTSEWMVYNVAANSSLLLEEFTP